MNMIEVIQSKKNKIPLTAEQIEFFVRSVTDGSAPDYQISALLMAICLNGLNDDELIMLTNYMTNSGDTVNLKNVNGITADKHSTGGVGDKTTLIVAPIVAALGLKVAKMSGRGLSFTGGTVDKLMSIPGFQTDISAESFVSQLQTVGIALVSQTGNLVPADKKLYALRDVTATVDSIPLIAASIMSKKLACSAECIVLDVKTGSGALLPNFEQSLELAETMVRIGKANHRKIRAVITDMNTPLGYACGNSLEIIEAVEILQNKHPHSNLRTVSIELAAHLLSLAGFGTIDRCRSISQQTIADGSALEKFLQMIQCQGGDTSVIINTDNFKRAKIQITVTAESSGYISAVDAKQIGMACCALGAGRVRKEDSIDYHAGIIFEKSIGDFVNAGDPLATLHTSDSAVLEYTSDLVKQSFAFSDSAIALNSPILQIVE